MKNLTELEDVWYETLYLVIEFYENSLYGILGSNSRYHGDINPDDGTMRLGNLEFTLPNGEYYTFKDINDVVYDNLESIQDEIINYLVDYVTYNDTGSILYKDLYVVLSKEDDSFIFSVNGYENEVTLSFKDIGSVKEKIEEYYQLAKSSKVNPKNYHVLASSCIDKFDEMETGETIEINGITVTKFDGGFTDDDFVIIDVNGGVPLNLGSRNKFIDLMEHVEGYRTFMQSFSPIDLNSYELESALEEYKERL